MRDTGQLAAGRVALFIDYQNVYMGAREAFFPEGAHHWCGQVRPGRLGVKLTGVGDDRRRLVAVRVYRGQPSQTRDTKAARAFGRQVNAWKQEVLTTPVTRPLNYRTNPPREKGIDVQLAVDFVAGAIRDEYDVGIIFSGDTDLLPALELVAALKGDSAIEVAAWASDLGGSRRLRLDARRPWCHLLDLTDFNHVADDTDYTLRTRRR